MWKLVVGFWAFVALLAVLHGVVGALPNFGLPDLTVGCMLDEKGFWASFCDFFNRFLIKNADDFLNVLGIFGIILLTILVPVVIFVFNNKRDFKALDLNVILDHVVDARRFLIYLSLVYIPLLFWAGSSYPFRIVEVIIWFVGVCCLGKVLFNSYRWMKEEKSELRYEYLKKLKNPREVRENWNSVWQVEDMDINNEKQFFTIFSSTMDNLLKGNVEKIKIAAGLANDFNSFIDKRSINNFKEFFLKILEWPFIDSEKKRQLIREKESSDYQGLLLTFSDIIEKINKKALKEERIYHVVNGFVSHIKKHEEYFAKEKQGWEYHYSDAVISGFFDALAKNSENKKNIWIWRDFPSEWEITLENIKNKKNYVCIELYNKFILWASNRISNSTEHDDVLERFAYYLFPHGCPIMWSKILTFGVRSWVDGNRMKSLIERPLIFGRKDRNGPARVSGDEEEVGKKKQAEEKEMISLALFLFEDDFTKNNLKKFINELEKMKDDYKDKQEVEIRRKRYSYILDKLLKARCEIDDKEKMDEGK